MKTLIIEAIEFADAIVNIVMTEWMTLIPAGLVISALMIIVYSI